MTKPNLRAIERSEQKLSDKIEGLLQKALETAEVIEVEGKE